MIYHLAQLEHHGNVMTQTIWCYTSDENYIFPTLVSASQAKRQLKNSEDQVVIMCFGISDQIFLNVREVANSENILLIRVSKDILRGLPMYCARLFIYDIIASPASDLIYLDGDTQILSNLRALSEIKPKPGSLLAVPDLMALAIASSTPLGVKRSEYFHKLGLSADLQLRYFNSGVLKANMSDWKMISEDCVKFIMNNDMNNFHFLDQDVLNIISQGRHELLSIRWNCPAFFLRRGLDDLIDPVVLHFMSRPRPWEGGFLPWGLSGHVPYQQFIEAHPQLADFYRPFRGMKKLRYHIQQCSKAVMEDWGNETMRARIREFEKMAVI